ncbi:MAG: class I SAM-dependent methyltransferase, partial [Betaproteobacteria bacterium]|nr:class I SAM-dependent methyltransferase [Betaproteobacteria bacterium]
MTTPSTQAAAATAGEAYERIMGRWSRRLVGPFLDFVGTADGEEVLDVGCGTGCVAFAVAERCNVRNVQGIDLSPAYVAHARHVNRDARLAFDIGNVHALDLPDRS